MVVTPLNLTAVPMCGIKCLASGLSTSSCLSTNTTCFCLDQAYNDFVTSCVLGNCTVREQLSTQLATSTSCDVQYNDTDNNLKLVHAALFATQSIFFLLRMVSRAARLAPWGWDDSTIVVTWIFSVCFLYSGIYEAALGAGRPFYTRPFDAIDQAVFIFFVFEILYLITLGMIKISICFLYMRIFAHPTFQRVMWATQAFNAAVIVAFLVVTCTQCRPLRTFWTSWDGVRVGQCINLNAGAYAHAWINIALDVWMLALPATQVWRLNMSLRKKLEVMLMFSFGMFLTAISIVRLTVLQWFAKNRTDVGNYYAVAVWATAEISTGILVACIPAARIVVLKYAGSVMVATGLSSRSDRSDLPRHAKSSGASSSGLDSRPGGGGKRLSKFRLPMPSLGSSRLLSSIARELGTDSRGQPTMLDAARTGTVSEEQLARRESPVELETVAFDGDVKVSSSRSS